MGADEFQIMFDLRNSSSRVAQPDKIERVGEIALGGFLFRRDIRKELHSELHGGTPI